MARKAKPSPDRSTDAAAPDLLFAPAAPPVPVAAAPPRPTATVTELPRRPAAGGVGAKLAKPGFGLLMRTSDGEDSMAPFRSLDDLLSAIKPILRGAARSAEPIWFSVQPIDLGMIDVDAA